VCILASRGFADPATRRAQQAALIVGIALGVLLVAGRAYTNGNGRQLADLTSLIRSRLNGCLFVYEGDPALYETTHACFVSRFVSRTHQKKGKGAEALATNGDGKTGRVLAKTPSVIVMADRPRPFLTNLETRGLVEAAVRQRYRLAGTRTVGVNKWLVYSL